MPRPTLGAAALAMLLVACAQSGEPRKVVLMEGGDPRGSRQQLEAARAENPDDVELRIELGAVYYKIARDALDQSRDEARYRAYLERSMEEFFTALELDPTNESPHFYLALMDVYRGKPWKALRGFDNARKLAPEGVTYTNIAEMFVYLDRPETARAWNQKGWRLGAPPGAVVFNDMLLAWREGDLPQARKHFETLRTRYSEALRTINVASLAEPPRRFEEFAGYCCGSPACGPYMEAPCRALELRVEPRAVSEETLLKELRLEIERERRLGGIYQQRKELEIDVEGEGEYAPDPEDGAATE
jgi:tetratricopeptide (TPR) repeat protein